MDIFGFLGSLFGGNKKKKEQQPAAAPIVSASSPLNQKPTINLGSVRAPQPFAPQNQNSPQSPPSVAPIRLGGVDNSSLPKFAQPQNNLPQFPGAQPAKQHTLIDAANDVGDVAGIANRTAARDLVGGVANIANTAGTLMGGGGYNPQEIQKRTNDFLDTVGLQENGNNGLNTGVDYNNEVAQRVGRIAGTIIGNAPATVAQVASGTEAGNLVRALPQVERLANLGRLGRVGAATAESVAGGVPATAIGQATNPAQTPQDAAANTALDFALGAASGLIPEVSTARALARTPQNIAEDAGIAAAAGTKGVRAGELAAQEIATPPLPPREPLPSVMPPLPKEEVPAITTPVNKLTTPTISPSKAETPAITTPQSRAAAATVQPPQQFEIGANRAGINTIAPQPTTVQPLAAAAATKKEQAAIEEQLAKQAIEQPPVTEPTKTAPAETPNLAASKAAPAPTPSPADVAAAARSTEQAQAPTQAAADELGSITRNALLNGSVNSDTEAQALADRVGSAIEKAAEDAGTTWDKINRKIQAAYSGKAKTAAEANLSPAELDVANRAANELSTLRERVEPSLVTGRKVQFYAPRQAEDTAYNSELVNEIARLTNGMGVDNNALDYSTTPYRQAIRRYANQADATISHLSNAAENRVVRDVSGSADQLVPTGTKISDQTKQAIRPDVEEYHAAQNDAARAIQGGDLNTFNDAISRSDNAINRAINRMAEDIGSNRQAVDSLTDTRKAYLQSTMRTNMFLNIANRIYDQFGKLEANIGDTLLPIANKVSNSMLSGKGGLATGGAARSVARQYAKGALTNQLNRNLKTNIQLAGAGSRNPLTKGIAKLDAAYRGIGTYATSLGDLQKNAVKAANMKFLGDAQATGITDKAGLEKYLADKVNTPEYNDVVHEMSNIYGGYVGMPNSISGLNDGDNKVSQFLSRADNLVRNSTDRLPIPARAKQELNDLIMPSLTGFAGATSRIASRGLNAMALGIPQIRKGLELASSDLPNAKAVGQMMISRSLIDAASAGGATTAGLLLGSTGHWVGSYPSDPNEQARWARDGITPDSFEFDIGGKKVYVQPGRVLGALALPAVLPAVAANAIQNGDSPSDAVGQVLDGTLGQLMNNLGVDALGQHISDIVKLTSGNETDKANASRDLINALGFSLSNVVPAAGLQNNVANALDPYKRDTSGNIANTIESRNPFTRGSVPVKKDAFGNPITNNTQATLGSSAVTVGADNTAPQTDPLNAEIDRLAKAGSEVTPTKQNTNADNGVSQELGKLLLDDPIYTQADDKTKGDILKGVLAGTSTRDFNANLDNTSKQALLDYKILGKKKGDVWLQNNDNAANYYKAVYDNADANGTLTTKDNNLNNKSGKRYQMIQAQVNQQFQADQDLQQLYNDTDVTEWRAMGNPESDSYDPTTYNKLMTYDDARTKAGVSGASSDSGKNKYVPKKSGKGGKGGRAGSGSKNFTFASNPSSLVGTAKGGGYAEATSLFKPIPDLQAPASAQAPKARTISIKKGVSL